MSKFSFDVGSEYRRRAVKELVGAGLEAEIGGPWDGGLASHDGAHFIFCNIGIPGRTGHDYGNFWAGDDLDWSGATASRADWPSIQRVVTAGAEVHVFYRNRSSDDFTYAGLGRAVDVSNGSPVRVLWRFAEDSESATSTASKQKEGAKKQKLVTVVERSPAARRQCLEHHKAICAVCALNFTERYGPIGAGFMHVHHLTMVSTLPEETEIDPINDLRPVCPNCHAMLHRTKPPLTIEALKGMLK